MTPLLLQPRRQLRVVCLLYQCLQATMQPADITTIRFEICLYISILTCQELNKTIIT